MADNCALGNHMSFGRFLAAVVIAAIAAGPAFSEVSKTQLACLMDKTKCPRAPADAAPAKVPKLPKTVNAPAKSTRQPTVTADQPQAAGTVAADMEALHLVSVDEAGKSVPNLSAAVIGFQKALGRSPTSSLKKEEKSFLHSFALWSGASADLAQAYVDLGPTGLALLTQAFRNADVATSRSLPRVTDASEMGESAASFATLCGPISSGNVAITASFDSNGQRLGWLFATRAACELRALLLVSAVKDQSFSTVFDPGLTAKCGGLVSDVLQKTGNGFEFSPDQMTARVKRGYFSGQSNPEQGEARSLARNCLLAGLYRDDANQSLAASVVLNALGDNSYALLVSAQLRWGIGIPSDGESAGQWLQRAAMSQGQPGEMPGVLRHWAEMSWQAING